MVSMFYFLMLPLLIRGQNSFWDKHYITYSIENDFYRTETIKNLIEEMEINSLEIEYTRPGKGDIQFYFTNFMLDNNILGIAQPPDGGLVTIIRPAVRRRQANMSKVIQHEFAHALGLDHSNNNQSSMYPIYMNGSSFLQADKDKLNELYKCRYDSVTLLNDRTYMKFKGRHYERIDLDRDSIFKNKTWHPSIFKVNAMYRNNSYFVISNNFKYFEYNNSLQLIKEGYIRDIFPNINGIISAVLNLRNGSIICFLESGDIWHDGVVSNPNIFNFLPRGIIQGAFSTFNRIYLVAKDYIYTYDENFNFITQNRLCDHPKFQKVHCCNRYSNH